MPAAWKGSNVLLNFGAVDWKADVFVNDILAGSHTGGFTPFSLDITPYLNAKGEQKLVVRVFDGTDKGYQPRGKQVLNPNGIWYTPVSGIWQTVWIEPVAKSHISGIKAIPNLDQKNIAVTVAAENCTTGDLVEVKILDKGKLVASATGLPGSPLRLCIAEPKLWSPDSPFLYDMEVSLRAVRTRTARRSRRTTSARSGRRSWISACLPRASWHGFPSTRHGASSTPSAS